MPAEVPILQAAAYDGIELLHVPRMRPTTSLMDCAFVGVYEPRYSNGENPCADVGVNPQTRIAQLFKLGLALGSCWVNLGMWPLK
jgi:hypothetical protein